MKGCYVAVIRHSHNGCDVNFTEIIQICCVAQKCCSEIAVDHEGSSY